MSWKRIALILLILFVGYYLFFLVFPLVLVGPPTSLYYLSNHDDVSHNVTVQIFDDSNITVLKKHYILDTNESISLDREIRWYFPTPSTFVTWSDGVYTFNFTVDNVVSEEVTEEIGQYLTVAVRLKSGENETVNLDVGFWAV